MLTFRQKFGHKLKQIRKSRSLTQEQLAEILSISVEFVSNMERGINAPSFDTLERLSQALNTTVKEFFDFDN